MQLGLVSSKALVTRGQRAPDPEPKPVTHIPQDDERDLRAYFKEERARAMSGGGSNFASSLERLERYSGYVVPCVHCGGMPEMRDEEGDCIQEESAGTGFVTSGYGFRQWRHLAKDGRSREEILAWLDRHNSRERAFIDPVTAKREVVVEGEINCPKCCDPKVESHRWTPGWVVRRGRRSGKRVTVHITAEVQATPSLEVVGGNDSLALLGRVGRNVDAVRAYDGLVGAALELFYSPDGGSAAALWCLTKAGQGLLKENKNDVPQQEFFRSLRMMQETNKSTGMAARFRQADRQSSDLLKRAHTVWMEVVYPA